MYKGEITTPQRIRHFLSQVAVESDGLRAFAEYADGSDYEGRADLGNTQPGDGRRFKGVDVIQMTGRANYQDFADWIGDQRVMEGWQYVMANYRFIPSIFWWTNNQMNKLCDRSDVTVEKVTRRVNGGTRALNERIEYYQKAKEVIS